MNDSENKFLNKLKNIVDINDNEFLSLIKGFKIEKINLYETYIQNCNNWSVYKKLDYLVEILELDINKKRLSNDLYNENNWYDSFEQDIIINVLVYFLEQCLVYIDKNPDLDISTFYALIGSFLNTDGW